MIRCFPRKIQCFVNFAFNYVAECTVSLLEFINLDPKTPLKINNFDEVKFGDILLLRMKKTAEINGIAVRINKNHLPESMVASQIQLFQYLHNVVQKVFTVFFYTFGIEVFVFC